MNKVLATLAAVLAAIMIVSVGCSSGQTTTTTNPTTTTTATTATTTATGATTTTTTAATTKATTTTTVAPTTTATSSPTPAIPSGTLTMAVSSLFGGSLDPRKNASVGYINWAYASAVLDSLVEYNIGSQVMPGLAERYEKSADGKAWTFYLRKGVKWHDGSNLTAADVKFTMDEVLAPDSLDSSGSTWRSLVNNVEVKDDYTVVVNLKAPQGELWTGLQQPGLGPNTILPKKYIEQNGIDYFTQRPMGSGPYKIVKYEPSKSVELEAVGNWRVMPKIKTIKVVAVPEAATRIAMLKTGEIDMTEITSDSVKEVQAAGLKVTSYASGSQSGLAFYYDPASPGTNPLGNPNVRKALSLAINREEMGSKLFGGYAKPSAVFGAVPAAYFFDPNVLKPDPYDPAQAKKLLADAGYASGFSIKLYDAPFAAWMSIHNQAVGGYWSAVGVNTQIVPLETAALLSMFRPKPKPDLVGNAATYLAIGNPFFRLGVFYGSGGVHSNSSANLDPLLAQVNSTMDMTQRKALATQFALAAQQERGMVSVLDFQSIWGMSNRVGSWTPVGGLVAPALSFETATLK